MSVSIKKGTNMYYWPWPTVCFYCHKNIVETEGVIHWHGQSDISLHKNCAAEFMIHIGSDLVKLKDLIKKRDEIQIF